MPTPTYILYLFLSSSAVSFRVLVEILLKKKEPVNMHCLKPTLPFILAAATIAYAQHIDATTTTSADNAISTECAAEK
jgi:hypothetical protein